MAAQVKLSEDAKKIVLGTLLAISIALIFIFHFVLDSGIVFTQFFYLPIVVAAIWYYFRGMSVAFILGGALIISDLITGDHEILLDDLMRAIIFVGVSGVVATLSDRLRNLNLELERANAGLESKVAERTVELQEEKELLAVTLASISDGVITIDNAGRVRSINRYAEVRLGADRSRALGRPLSDIVKMIDDTGERSIMQGGAEKGSLVAFNGTTITTPWGARMVVDGGLSPIIMDGKVAGEVMVFLGRHRAGITEGADPTRSAPAFCRAHGRGHGP